MNDFAVRIEGYITFKLRSKGRVECATGMAASSKTIHPSKRRKVSLMPTRVAPVSSSAFEVETENDIMLDEEKLDEESTQTRRQYSKTGTATK